MTFRGAHDEQRRKKLEWGPGKCFFLVLLPSALSAYEEKNNQKKQYEYQPLTCNKLFSIY